LTTPLLRCIGNQIPGTSIHFVTKDIYASLIDRHPQVVKVHVLRDSFPQLVEELRNENFDLIIDLHSSLRSRRLSFLLAKKTYRVKKKYFLKWLIVRLKLKKQVPHIVHRYFQAVRELGLDYDGNGLEFHVLEEEKLFSQSLLPSEFKKGFIAITVGAKHFTKAMPEEKIIEFIRLMNKPVALVGGILESEKAKNIMKKISLPAVNLCGKLSLGMSGAIIQMSEGVIAHDTGLMHMAAALEKPMVVIWGNTTPLLGMSPLYPDGKHMLVSYSEVGNLACRPCHRIGRNKCPNRHFHCMTLQNVDYIKLLLLEKIKLSAQ